MEHDIHQKLSTASCPSIDGNLVPEVSRENVYLRDVPTISIR
jgi:hypothetical protein